MNLQTYLEILWRRKWAIILTAAITLAVVIIGTFMMAPTYRASTTLRIATPSSGSIGNFRYDITYADRLMNTYAKIAKSKPVLAELAQQLNLNGPPEVEVEILANTELMQLKVVDPDPLVAAQGANLLAEILIAQSQELNADGQTAREILSEQLAQVGEELGQARLEYEQLVEQSPEDSEGILAANRNVELSQGIYATLLEQYEQARFREAVQANTLSVVEPATIPRNPAQPNRLLNIVLGSVAGLAGGIALAFLFENLDTTLYTTEQIEKATGLSTLGKIPLAKKQLQISLLNGHSPHAEAFRRLCTTITMLDQDAFPLALLITSAEPGEGKSTITASLALAVARFGRKVIVVDSDMRLPTLHKIFNLTNEAGLSNVLQQEATLDSAIQASTTPDVWLLTSGPQPSHPAELLNSQRMANLIVQLKQRFDLVLLDTPSLLAVSDATIMAPVVDGVVLVVGRAQARRETVQAARKQLDDVKARSVGIVVNRANGSNHYFDHYQSKVDSA
jgi:non-specific protein-tyrosine kinase